MSSEKPFWEGKTLMEIQNLDKRVKVTMENGDVFIGKLVRRSRDTDGICSLSMQLDAHRTYLHVFSAESSDTPPVIPSYVDTIELVDDPEYERIDNIENVQVGDIACTTEGNHFRVIGPQQQARDLSSSVPSGQGGGSMSIISSKAEHVYKSNTLMQEAYIAGASRQHTDEEIRAACLAIMPYVISQPSQQVFDFLTKATGAYPGQEIVWKVIEAMQRKATEE